MASRISNIFPFLIITVLCIGGVEGFYTAVEHFLLKPALSERVVVPVASEAVESQRPGASPVKRLDQTVITRRNLFGPPPQDNAGLEQEEAVSLEELEATTLEVVLMGTVDGGESSRAIIMGKKDRKQDIYRVGDSVQGAQIREIQRGKVVINHNGRDEMLDISEAAKYAPRSRSPVSVNQTLRRRRVLRTPTEVSPGDAGQPERPRIVRPSRRIVRPGVAPQPVEVEQEGGEEQELPPESELPDDAALPEEDVSPDEAETGGEVTVEQ